MAMVSTVGIDDRWQLGLRSISGESAEVELEVHGALPDQLRGHLYRVGPAGFEIGEDRYAHWFDGDAMVHRLTVEGGRLTYRSRWVESAARTAEQAAGRRIYAGGFWAPPPGGPLAKLRHARPKNVANINVVSHGGQLLALSEGGLPYRLDPVTLDTLGEDDLGVLRPGDGFSAHPKYDPATGECWNFGVRYGPTTRLTVYRADRAGTWSVVNAIKLSRGHMIHDMALTDRSVIILCSPFVLPRVPLRLMTGWRGYGQSLRWEPALGTTVVIVDRASGQIRTRHIDPFFVFHIAGAIDDGAEITIDVCTYPDATLVRAFADAMRGVSPAAIQPRLERIVLRGDGPARRLPLVGVPFELPRQQRGGALLGVTLGDGAGFLNTPCRFARATGRVTQATMAPWEFAGECVAVDDYVLTVVLDAAQEVSELRVLPGDLNGPPVATARLPHRVPFALHGNFVRAA